MGKIYAPPKEIGPAPEFREFRIDGKFNMGKMEEVEKEWTDKLRAWCKKDSPEHKYIGEIIREQVADGYAQYMVYSLKPLALIHLSLGDAYQFKWAHRWTASDVKAMIEQRKKLKSLFEQA